MDYHPGRHSRFPGRAGNHRPVPNPFPRGEYPPLPFHDQRWNPAHPRQYFQIPHCQGAGEPHRHLSLPLRTRLNQRLPAGCTTDCTAHGGGDCGNNGNNGCGQRPAMLTLGSSQSHSKSQFQSYSCSPRGTGAGSYSPPGLHLDPVHHPTPAPGR